MALYKEIKLDNGITLEYHRIMTINKITNDSNIIEVTSYINENQREKEKEAIEKKEPMNIFIYTNYINKEYNANENIEDCYSYLKTIEPFKNAQDI